MKLKEKIVSLKHGDKVIIEERKGYVGTVGGYATENNQHPHELIAHAKQNNHLLYWVNQACTVLADSGFYLSEEYKWRDAIHIEDGQLVWLDGQVLRVRYMGDYADMVHFEETYTIN